MSFAKRRQMAECKHTCMENSSAITARHTRRHIDHMQQQFWHRFAPRKKMILEAKETKPAPRHDMYWELIASAQAVRAYDTD